ncbi:hypothetical protein LVJ94_24635 [Pendulispora rubella]|uniref:PEGA domain-containing protein n=1 Tax=Pendulispora rubella TaxID=2741070 RepID=A0ABZ2LHI0_9BACT
MIPSILRPLAACALAIVLAAPAPLHAEPPRPVTEADRLFEAGRDASVKGDFARACLHFRESLRLDPTAVGTLINLGDCEENQGHPDVALAYYEQAFARLSVKDDRLPLVHDRISFLEKRSARLELRLGGGAPAETTVTLDGRVLERKELGVSLLLPAGNHLVVVTAVGYRGSRQGVSLGSGEARKLSVWPGPPLEEAVPTFVEHSAAAPHDRERHAGVLRALGIGALGLGVASLWVGSITGLFALDREHLRRDNCDANNVCNATGYDAARSGDTFATVSTITFAAGAVAVVGGLYLVLTNRPAPSPTTAIEPLVSPRGAGLTLRHAF